MNKYKEPPFPSSAQGRREYAPLLHRERQMSSAIKTCSSCGVLYTGDTKVCLGCALLKSSRGSKPAPEEKPLSRAQRRALEREQVAILKVEQRVKREMKIRLTDAIQHERVVKDRTSKASITVHKGSYQSVTGRDRPAVNRSSEANGRRAKPSNRVVHTKYQDTNPPGYTKVAGIEPKPAEGMSLGDMARSEGQRQARKQPNGVVIRVEIAQCTCRGENENCRRCYGNGYYERELVDAEVAERATSQIWRRPRSTSPSEVTFSVDGRGGPAFGVREFGRFASNPHHDDYDE